MKLLKKISFIPQRDTQKLSTQVVSLHDYSESVTELGQVDGQEAQNAKGRQMMGKEKSVSLSIIH